MIGKLAPRLALLALLYVGCARAEDSPCELHVHTAANEAGEFWASVDGSPPQRLMTKAQGYRPILSPNGAWLAVEPRLMSNLEVVRLFERQEIGFVPARLDVTRTAWERVSASGNLDPYQMDSARTRVHGWEDSGRKLVLELSVTGAKGEPKKVLVTIVLPDETD